MVVVDEKTMLPPPPSYSLRLTDPIHPVPEYPQPPPFVPVRNRSTISDLPSHLLLHVVHRTFPQVPDLSYNKLERQRKTLRWLTTSLRLVNRTFYIGMQFRSCVFPTMTEAHSRMIKWKQTLSSMHARPPINLPPLIHILYPAPLHIRSLPTHPGPIQRRMHATEQKPRDHRTGSLHRTQSTR